MGKEINNAEFKDCLKRNKIVPFPAAKKLAVREFKTAGEDLDAASESLKRGRDKWATIQAYYAMFHAARSLLYSRGLREKSHYCLIVAMKAIFVQEKILDLRLVEAFQMAKILRENADYQDEYSSDSAKVLVRKAQEFLQTAERILKK